MTAASMSMMVMKMKLRSRGERGERKKLLKTLFSRRIGDREKKPLWNGGIHIVLFFISGTGDDDWWKGEVGQVPLGTVVLASSWFKKTPEKVKYLVSTGEEIQSSNSPVLSRLSTNDMQFSRYWCFGVFFWGSSLSLMLGLHDLVIVSLLLLSFQTFTYYYLFLRLHACLMSPVLASTSAYQVWSISRYFS